MNWVEFVYSSLFSLSLSSDDPQSSHNMHVDEITKYSEIGEWIYMCMCKMEDGRRYRGREGGVDYSLYFKSLVGSFPEVPSNSPHLIRHRRSRKGKSVFSLLTVTRSICPHRVRDLTLCFAKGHDACSLIKM